MDSKKETRGHVDFYFLLGFFFELKLLIQSVSCYRDQYQLSYFNWNTLYMITFWDIFQEFCCLTCYTFILFWSYKVLNIRQAFNIFCMLYAVINNRAKRNFPILTFQYLFSKTHVKIWLHICKKYFSKILTAAIFYFTL